MRIEKYFKLSLSLIILSFVISGCNFTNTKWLGPSVPDLTRHENIQVLRIKDNMPQIPTTSLSDEENSYYKLKKAYEQIITPKASKSEDTKIETYTAKTPLFTSFLNSRMISKMLFTMPTMLFEPKELTKLNFEILTKKDIVEFESLTKKDIVEMVKFVGSNFGIMEFIDDKNLNITNKKYRAKKDEMDFPVYDRIRKYLYAYFKKDDGFIDRYGESIVKSEFTGAIGNDQIEAVIGIIWEAISDEFLPTPVWYMSKKRYDFILEDFSVKETTPLKETMSLMTYIKKVMTNPIKFPIANRSLKALNLLLQNPNVYSAYKVDFPEICKDKDAILKRCKDKDKDDPDECIERHCKIERLYKKWSKEQKVNVLKNINRLVLKQAIDETPKINDKKTYLTDFKKNDKTPTVVDYGRGIILKEIGGEGDKDAIDEREFKLMKFISGFAGVQARLMSGSVFKSFGKINLGFAIEGGLSFGDNDTHAKVVEKTFEVVAERLSLEALRKIFLDVEVKKDENGADQIQTNSAQKGRSFSYAHAVNLLGKLK